MGKLTVMRFFGDHMILQSGVENKVFGTSASPVEICIKDSSGNITSISAKGENGRWEAVLPPFRASFEPYEISFCDGNETIAFADVLFGELFHISGQSNMELPISRTIDPFDPHMPTENRYIREFRVPVQSCFGADEEYDDFLGGSWECAVGEKIFAMSAAGYYFAKELFEKYDVPVGLVNTAAGGAPVEARMTCAMLRGFGGYDEFLDKCTVPGYMEKTIAEDAEKFRKWCEALDASDTVSAKIFELTEFDGESELPFHFRNDPELKGFNGRIWFKRTFDIPEDIPIDGCDRLISLGAMIDADIVYINGIKVGETGYMYPPRIYTIPDGVLKHGENSVYIRLEVRTGMGGFVEEKRYCLKLGDHLIDLSGKWKRVIAAKAPFLTPDVFFQGLPLSMYAALTAPAFNIRFAGLIWYQAESNGNFEKYPKLFEEFVKMYRRRSGYDIPVVFAQLPNFADPLGGMPDGIWASIREAQRKCLDIPKTAMSVNIDTGESYDLHPLNKWDVGKRLALCAERLIYGDETAPVYVYPTSAVITPEGVRVSFNDPSKLTAKQLPMKKFTVLDENGTAYPCEAVLDGKGAVLSFDKRVVPVKVRYLWENDPDIVELYSDGLPVTPFEIAVS